MEERTIEVNVISATDLKNVKTFGRHQSSYVVAYVVPQRKRSTKVDSKSGLNPTWNSKLTFTCDERLLERGGLQLTLEIYAVGAFSDKLIGKVCIPLHVPVSTDGKQAKSEATRTEYSVRRPSGKAKGLLKLSVKLGEKKNIQTYTTTQQGYAYSQDYKKQSYPPASYPASTYQNYAGSYVNSAPAGGVYPPQKADAISPHSNSQGGVYPPPPPSSKTEFFPSTSGYSTSSGTTGVSVAYPLQGNAVYPPQPNAAYPPNVNTSTSLNASSSSSEPATAYPAIGYPVGTGYAHYTQQHPPQSYPPQGYPSHHHYSQQGPYYPPAQQAYYSKPPKKHSSGPGLGAGLLGGALGGLLLGEMLDFDC